MRRLARADYRLCWMQPGRHSRQTPGRLSRHKAGRWRVRCGKGGPLSFTVPELSYSELLAHDAACTDPTDVVNKVRESGIISITGTPCFQALRHNLLHSLDEFASLPQETKEKYTDPDSSYNFGWSIGVETLEGGVPDTSKGSFYANPLYDRPVQRGAFHAAYHRENIWPTEVPDLEKQVKEMGRLMNSIAVPLARMIDRYLDKQSGVSGSSSLCEKLERSQVPKARGLVYFPRNNAHSTSGVQNWCGEHKDHGLLTGLVPGMFLRNSKEVECPDPQCGLYIRTPDNTPRKVTLPPNSLAFQIGEALQFLSGGLFNATAHWVAPPCLDNSHSIRRISFAVFFQPDVDEVLDVGCRTGLEGVCKDTGGVTFGEFAANRFKLYHRS